MEAVLTSKPISPTAKISRFALYAWGVVVYNMLVIIWGAYVRASKSGAGCGSHWPLCNGEVLPNSSQLETIIEFTHRISSGLALLLVVGLLAAAFRIYPKRDPIRRAAAVSMFFILTEALIGAGLVLFELVAHDKSMARAFSLGAHLVNTFLLLASLVITAHLASGGALPKIELKKPLTFLFTIGILGTILLGVSGAFAALGDTLFPVSSVAEGIRQDLSATAHILLRLRIFHPVIALLVGILLLILSTRIIFNSGYDNTPKRWAWSLTALVVVQLIIGLVNVYLLAPTWLQLVHLLFADLLWIALVLLAITALENGERLSANYRSNP